MGLNFRKGIKLGAGIRLNLSKKGVGASVGIKGARVGIGPRGTRATTSIPGTGISYTKSLGYNKRYSKGYNQSTEQAEPAYIDYAKRRRINKILWPILLFIIAFLILVIVIINTVKLK